MRLNRLVEAAPEICKSDSFWNHAIQIYSERLKIYSKAEDYKPFTSFNNEVHNKLFANVVNIELKNKYFNMLLKKFLTEVKFTPVIYKMDLSNFIIN